MEPFLISRFPSFATFATPEVVAEMVAMRTLDGCKDMMFEARTMFEVVGGVLDMKMLDIAERILDVDKQKLDVRPKGPRKVTRRKDNIVNGFNDVANRMRMLDARGMTIDPNGWSRLDSSMTLGDFNAWRIDGGVSMLTKGVDRFKDISSRMIVIDNGVNGCMDVSSIFSRIIVVDKNVLGIDGCTGMLTKGVDGCKDIMMIVIDVCSRIIVVDKTVLGIDGCTRIHQNILFPGFTPSAPSAKTPDALTLGTHMYISTSTRSRII
jgi:hypothetical protein